MGDCKGVVDATESLQATSGDNQKVMGSEMCQNRVSCNKAKKDPIIRELRVATAFTGRLLLMNFNHSLLVR
jgi:hypothetical protein